MQGKGIFSTISGYVAGMGHGAMGRQASMLGQNVQAGYNMGQLGRQAYGALGTSGRSTLGGAAAGGAYGMMSGDTSMLGGAMMGAGLGRYGGAAARRLGRGPGAMGRGALTQARADFRAVRTNTPIVARAVQDRARAAYNFIGASLGGNVASNPIGSTLKR